mmetsp:Transcript_27381/g.38544  ORF Transcript_27381/g.38544 Transcript_27381/m.38544 type:complete len:502 (+) Transcript_27381:68-1573(+)
MKVSRTALATAMFMSACSVHAFTVPSSLTSSKFRTNSKLNVASVEPPTINGKDTKEGDGVPMGWDCDENMECKEVPLCDDEGCRTTLDCRIHGEWYDLSGWRKAHPAGEHWIDWYDGRDATEVMDGFHSDKARQMYKRLPKSKTETAQMLEAMALPDSSTQINFRALREELENEGWWDRNYLHEATLISIWASLVVGAGLTAGTAPPVATILLGLSMTAAGWLGHDYIHGVDDFSSKLRNFAAVAAGLAPTWWSDKHNKHHALTNEMGVDEDIATDPFLFTWAPDPSEDSPLRKIQHLYFFVPFSALFALWRVDSVTVTVNAVEEKRPGAKSELFSLMAHYAVLFTVFPLAVWVPAVFLSGLLSAIIVTPTHQNEEMFEDYQSDFVTAQFQSTRNAVTTNPFSEWIWGGMQYQLEHHLFPSMPRMRYPALHDKLVQFAKDNNVPGGYRETDEFQIIKENWELYKRVAEADAVPGAPSTRGRPNQLGAIRNGFSPAAAQTRV